MAEAEKITLQEAYVRYGVPIATLRYWLDKRELTRQYDEQRRVVVDVAELERRLEGRPYEPPKGKKSSDGGSGSSSGSARAG